MKMEKMTDKTEKAQQLWQRYLMISEEMDKFLKKEDIDMFLTLLEQRGVLQNDLEELNDRTFTASAEGKQLLSEIMKISADLQYKSQVWLNQAKKNRGMARAYENLGYGNSISGYNLNKNY